MEPRPNRPGEPVRQVLYFECRISTSTSRLYFSSERVVPITYPRTLASACQDLKRMEEWDNGNYNIWEVSLSPWLSDHQGQTAHERMRLRLDVGLSNSGALKNNGEY